MLSSLTSSSGSEAVSSDGRSSAITKYSDEKNGVEEGSTQTENVSEASNLKEGEPMKSKRNVVASSSTFSPTGATDIGRLEEEQGQAQRKQPEHVPEGFAESLHQSSYSSLRAPYRSGQQRMQVSSLPSRKKESDIDCLPALPTFTHAGIVAGNDAMAAADNNVSGVGRLTSLSFVDSDGLTPRAKQMMTLSANHASFTSETAASSRSNDEKDLEAAGRTSPDVNNDKSKTSTVVATRQTQGGSKRKPIMLMARGPSEGHLDCGQRAEGSEPKTAIHRRDIKLKLGECVPAVAKPLVGERSMINTVASVSSGCVKDKMVEPAASPAAVSLPGHGDKTQPNRGERLVGSGVYSVDTMTSPTATATATTHSGDGAKSETYTITNVRNTAVPEETLCAEEIVLKKGANGSAFSHDALDANIRDNEMLTASCPSDRHLESRRNVVVKPKLGERATTAGIVTVHSSGDAELRQVLSRGTKNLPSVDVVKPKREERATTPCVVLVKNSVTVKPKPVERAATTPGVFAATRSVENVVRGSTSCRSSESSRNGEETEKDVIMRVRKARAEDVIAMNRFSVSAPQHDSVGVNKRDQVILAAREPSDSNLEPRPIVSGKTTVLERAITPGVVAVHSPGDTRLRLGERLTSPVVKALPGLVVSKPKLKERATTPGIVAINGSGHAKQKPEDPRVSLEENHDSSLSSQAIETARDETRSDCFSVTKDRNAAVLKAAMLKTHSAEDFILTKGVSAPVPHHENFDAKNRDQVILVAKGPSDRHLESRTGVSAKPKPVERSKTPGVVAVHGSGGRRLAERVTSPAVQALPGFVVSKPKLEEQAITPGIVTVNGSGDAKPRLGDRVKVPGVVARTVSGGNFVGASISNPTIETGRGEEKSDKESVTKERNAAVLEAFGAEDVVQVGNEPKSDRSSSQTNVRNQVILAARGPSDRNFVAGSKSKIAKRARIPGVVNVVGPDNARLKRGERATSLGANAVSGLGVMKPKLVERATTAPGAVEGNRHGDAKPTNGERAITPGVVSVNHLNIESDRDDEKSRKAVTRIRNAAVLDAVGTLSHGAAADKDKRDQVILDARGPSDRHLERSSVGSWANVSSIDKSSNKERALERSKVPGAFAVSGSGRSGQGSKPKLMERAPGVVDGNRHGDAKSKLGERAMVPGVFSVKRTIENDGDDELSRKATMRARNIAVLDAVGTLSRGAAADKKKRDQVILDARGPSDRHLEQSSGGSWETLSSIVKPSKKERAFERTAVPGAFAVSGSGRSVQGSGPTGDGKMRLPRTTHTSESPSEDQTIDVPRESYKDKQSMDRNRDTVSGAVSVLSGRGAKGNHLIKDGGGLTQTVVRTGAVLKATEAKNVFPQKDTDVSVLEPGIVDGNKRDQIILYSSEPPDLHIDSGSGSRREGSLLSKGKEPSLKAEQNERAKVPGAVAMSSLAIAKGNAKTRAPRIIIPRDPSSRQQSSSVVSSAMAGTVEVSKTGKALVKTLSSSLPDEKSKHRVPGIVPGRNPSCLILDSPVGGKMYASEPGVQAGDQVVGGGPAANKHFGRQEFHPSVDPTADFPLEKAANGSLRQQQLVRAQQPSFTLHAEALRDETRSGGVIPLEVSSSGIIPPSPPFIAQDASSATNQFGSSTDSFRDYPSLYTSEAIVKDGGGALEGHKYHSQEDEKLPTAVLVPDSELDEEQFIPAAEEFDPTHKLPAYLRRKRRLVALLSACLLVVAAIAVGVSIGIVNKMRKDVPVCDKDSMGYFDKLSEVSGESLCNTYTPQYDAYQWIMHEDQRSLQPNDPSLKQRYVLALLYFSTGGDDWTFCNRTEGGEDCMHTCFHSDCERDGCEITSCTSRGCYGYCNGTRFLTPRHECEWYGVECVDNSTIQELKLQENNLNGRLPSEIFGLSTLENVQMNSNNITGSLPSSIGNLANLTRFGARYNSITGSIPDDFYELQSLKVVDLSKNLLTGTISPKIGKLRSLEQFHIHSNSLRGNLPTEIWQLKTLLWLHAPRNNFTGQIPEEIGGLSKLFFLMLDHNAFSGTIPPTIGNMTNINRIQLHHNRIGGSLPEELFSLSALSFLALQYNQLTGTLSSRVGELASLKNISLHHNRFNGLIPRELANLTLVEEIALHSNEFTGTVPESICNLRQNSSFFNYMSTDCVYGGRVECDRDCCTACCSHRDDQCYET